MWGRLQLGQHLTLAGPLVREPPAYLCVVPWGQALIGEAEDLDFGTRSMGSPWLRQVALVSWRMAPAWLEEMQSDRLEWCR